MKRKASARLTFRPMVPADWQEVVEIYRQGIDSGGFRILGTHERLGRFHDGRWRDVVLMERRSRVAGVD